MYINHRQAVIYGASVAAAAALMFLLVALEVTAVERVDEWFHDLMVAAYFEPLEWLARGFDFLGGAWVSVPIRLGVVVWLATKRRWAHMTAFLLAVVVSEISIGLLKDAYARPRPLDSLVDTTGFAFPSGHAIATVVTAVGLIVVLLPPGPRRWAWEARAVLFAFFMAISRTYLRAHWLSDVVGGTLFGTAVVLGSVALVIGVRDRQREKSALMHEIPFESEPTARSKRHR